MARNIEIKARIASAEALAAVAGQAAALATERPFELTQDDTFFACDAGRLKLRTFSVTSGELIFYRRANQAGPKESFYVRSPTSEPGSLREALTLAWGQAGRVHKRRTVYLVGRTRVHLDEVLGLGHFVELEVVLRAGEAPEAGVLEATELMNRLGIQPQQLLEDAYVDLLGRAGAEEAKT